MANFLKIFCYSHIASVQWQERKWMEGVKVLKAALTCRKKH